MAESDVAIDDGRIDLVIFDHDGVLVDSELIANEVLAETLTEIGYPIDVEQSMLSFMGKTFVAICQEVESSLGRRLPPSFAQLHDDRLFERLDQDLHPVEGIDEVLKTVRDIGVPSCIASGSSLRRVERSMRATGLLHHFEGHIYSAEEVRRGKPAPDLFFHAAQREGVAPGRTLVVEDSPSGVAAGKAAGMTTVAYSGRTAALSLCDADLTFATMVEVAEALRVRLAEGRPSADR